MIREEFEMTQKDLDVILDACEPVAMIMLQCGLPTSSQENANTAWKMLGKKMGFQYLTVKPTVKGERFFTAEPIAPKELN